MKYQAVLFDLDGTLLNTLEDLTDAVNHVMEHFGYPLHDLAAIRSFVGNGIRNLMARATPGGEENPHFEEAFQMFRKYYQGHSNIKTRPYDGIMETLREVKKRGVAMAIVSNKAQEAVADLAEIYFDGLITVAVGDGEGRARKPAPDAPLEALRRLRLQADGANVLYVGDSDVDAVTAANAGFDCLLVSWGFRSRELLAQQVSIGMIDEPAELLTLL